MLFVISCSNPNQNQIDPFRVKVLGEQFDAKGRLVKRVITQRIPGEDIFLTITQYDTLGNITEAYGAKPYGNKYRSAFRYDQQGRLIEELNYKFDPYYFENHSDKPLYELADTAVSFVGIIEYKTIYQYLPDSLVLEYYYTAEYDSVRKQRFFQLLEVDTANMREEGYEQLKSQSYIR